MDVQSGTSSNRVKGARHGGSPSHVGDDVVGYLKIGDVAEIAARTGWKHLGVREEFAAGNQHEHLRVVYVFQAANDSEDRAALRLVKGGCDSELVVVRGSRDVKVSTAG